MLTAPRWLGAVLFPWLLTPSQAWTQDGAPVGANPPWSWEIRGGLLRPELEQFETFYGDDEETYFALAATYRFRGWLEVGAELGQMRATGVGLLTSTGQLGGTVRYRLNPVHVFANAIYQRAPHQRLVPYVGVGIATLVYEQEVEQQPDIDGRTDAGYAARAGLRLLLTSSDPGTAVSSSRYHSYWQSYVFLEVQYMTAEVDDIDLGGDAYLLGFRVEFDLGPDR